jgi:hypothetical protein
MCGHSFTPSREDRAPGTPILWNGRARFSFFAYTKSGNALEDLPVEKLVLFPARRARRSDGTREEQSGANGDHDRGNVGLKGEKPLREGMKIDPEHFRTSPM